MSDEAEQKKQRVIHTRVSETLDEEIRRRAEGLGVSVSNLIRNVLGHSFGLVEDVIVDGANVARSARGEPARGSESARPAEKPGVLLGWQSIQLARNALCARCNGILARGQDASIPLWDGSPGPRTILCHTCVRDEIASEEAP